MKPTNYGLRRRKIMLYYALAVMLPGILLGYMAYRGIRNDQALREKESRKRLEMNSQEFFSAIDSSFVLFMNERIADSVFYGTQLVDPSLLVWFAKNTNHSTKLISHQLLYVPAELISIKPDQSGQSTNMKEGLRLEFIESRFSEAISFYQDMTIKTTNPAEKILAMVATARLYYKMNRHVQAKALYNDIRNNYPGRLLKDQIPTSLIACLEILKINRANREKDEMRNNSRKCLELLLHPNCEYDENQFDLFYQSFKGIIKETDPVTDSLFSELDTQKVRTDYLIRIFNRADLIPTTDNNHFKGSNNGMSIIPINSNALTALYLSWDRKNGVQTFMVIDFPVYLKSISEKLIQKLDPDSSINIKIEDNNGRLAFSKIINEETGYLSFPFPEYLPQWKLLLSENKPGFITTLLKAGSGIYLFIFILIALLMILGFIFIMYTLNVEFRLNKMKSEFISNVSHELKSPLTSIRMMTEMLHRNRVQTEDRKMVYYSTMLEESEHLSHLIDNILDFSRMEDDRKKYDFTDLDLNELLLKFLESTREMLPEPGFDIRYSRPDRIPVIKADKNAILQVFYNLVDNAIKFSGTSRQIDISMFSKDEELLFCVKDYGIGISRKEQLKIFDRFYRGDEPQRLGIKGSGIGLTLVKQIVEAHGGTINIESEPGKGSRVVIRLPVFGI